LFDPFGSSDASITDFLAEESLREDKVFGRRNWPVQALRSAFGPASPSGSRAGALAMDTRPADLSRISLDARQISTLEQPRYGERLFERCDSASRSPAQVGPVGQLLLAIRRLLHVAEPCRRPEAERASGNARGPTTGLRRRANLRRANAEGVASHG
jgi:hypothetical protein